MQRVSRGTVLGISFDGLEISGIVNEFLHLAYLFHRRGYRVLLDLGYEITLGVTPDHEPLIPSWVEVVRTVERRQIATYSQDAIRDAANLVTAGTPVTRSSYAEISQQLAALLLEAFVRERVELLVIENGTIPTNPIFTEALYIAINEYASQQRLKKFVLWRDWDLMWSAEPHLYGKYPFPGVHKPEHRNHIHYAVATEWMKRRMQAWAPGVDYHVIPSRFFVSTLHSTRTRSLRTAFAIPHDAHLVARCTRVIPQKSIERDLRLFDLVQQRLISSGDPRQIFLFVTGPTTENAPEFRRLCDLQKTLSLAGQVIWGNGLLPFCSFLSTPPLVMSHFSIQELLAESNLSSFLTSFDYEGFGNPPGEAMAAGVPFIATTYELYHAAYGSKGAIAPLLPIHRASAPSDSIPDEFVTWVMKLLTDDAYRSQVIEHNLSVCRRFFSLADLERQINEIFGPQ